MTANPVSVPKVIWLLWLQGWDQVPDMVQACRTSWTNRNPGWKVWLLDQAMLDTFIPSTQLKRIMSSNAPREALSDLVRLELLHRYGGVWADATTICAKPLDDWLDEYTREGFFAFDRPRPDRMISTWFLAAHKGSYIVESWREAAARYWHGRSQRDDYFWVHKLFEQTYATDAQFNSIWNKAPKISSKHLFHFGPNAVSLFESPTPAHSNGLVAPPVPVFKLTHKMSKPTGDHSLMSAICAFANQGQENKIPVPSRRVLLAWHGSFAQGTLGDLHSVESVATHLHALGHQVSHATELDLEITGCQRVDWRVVDRASFDCMLFVGASTSPLHVDFSRLLARFSFVRMAAVSVSPVSQDGLDQLNPFQTVFAGQGSDRDFGDVAILAPTAPRTISLEGKRIPRIGVALCGQQTEYGPDRCLWAETDTLLLHAAQTAARRFHGEVITIENELVHSVESPDEVQQQYAECDLILTSSFHSAIEALRSGVPFIAADQIKGGEKVTALLSKLDWPHVYLIEEADLDKVADAACALLADPLRTQLQVARQNAIFRANETLHAVSEWVSTNTQ